MIAGHFGLAAAVKAQERSIPLWALMLGTQLLDVIFVPLFIAGIETIERVPGRGAYGGGIIHANYTHSLVGALVIALVAGLLAGWAWSRRAGLVIGGVVFSHWLLDLLVHRPDLPILPGDPAGWPRLGFGLWEYPALTAILEAVLVLGGAFLYYRAASALPVPASQSASEHRSRVLLATGVTALVMVLTLALDILGVG